MRLPSNPSAGGKARALPDRKGLAPVIAPSLLALLAGGALALSSNALRATAKEQAQAVAEANALLSLAMAPGATQLQLRPDQRILASGSSLAAVPVANPRWTGVRDSPRAGPGESSQHQTINSEAGQLMAPTYAPGREDHFRSWQVSLDPAGAAMPDRSSTADGPEEARQFP